MLITSYVRSPEKALTAEYSIKTIKISNIQCHQGLTLELRKFSSVSIGKSNTALSH